MMKAIQRLLTATLIGFSIAVVTPIAADATAQPQSLTPQAAQVARWFDDAANEFDVPVELLQAIGYSESRWTQLAPPSERVDSIREELRIPKNTPRLQESEGEEGHPPPSYGIMGLRDDRLFGHSLLQAAALVGHTPEELIADPELNIRGAAALLKSLSGGLSRESSIETWASAVERYSGIPQPDIAQMQSYEVYNAIRSGRTTDEFRIAQRDVDLVQVYGAERLRVLSSPRLTIDVSSRPPESGPSALSIDYGPAIWNPAASCNYSSGRSLSITHITIHVTQGSYSSSISWFQNCSSQVSAHYVVRSSDGQITQMVRESDKAWHVGSENGYTVGIEHEGFIANPSAWFTDAMYNASSLLTRDISNSHGIPTSGVYDGSLGWSAVLSTSGPYKVKGHVNFPNQTHQDPGSGWDWARYRRLVAGGGWSATVDNSSSRFRASTNWNLSSYSAQRYGADYRYTTPLAVSDGAWYSFPVPSSGNYEVYAWYPASSGYNSSTPYIVATSGGNVVKYVNQQVNGGTWVSLGIFNISGGDHDVVAVSRWTSTGGYVIADAVRLVQR